MPDADRGEEAHARGGVVEEGQQRLARVVALDVAQAARGLGAYLGVFVREEGQEVQGRQEGGARELAQAPQGVQAREL